MRGRRQQVKRRLKSEFEFNVHRDYSISNVRDLSWSWIPKSLIQVKKEKENFVVACLRLV